MTNKTQSNTDKILKLIDKFEVDDLPELNKVIKERMTQKVMSKSQEYSELAEKLLSLSDNLK